MKRNKTLESDAINHSKKYCHPAHDDEQQQHATASICSNYSNIATHKTAVALCIHEHILGTYKYVVQRCNQIYQVLVYRYSVVKPHTVWCLNKKN